MVTALLLALSVLAGAQTPHSEVEVVAAQSSFAPGRPVEAALRFTMERDWHIYWINPGDSGTAPTVRWSEPKGVSAGELAFPFPSYLESGPLASFAYETEILLPFLLSTDGDAAGGTLRGVVDYLVCRVECLPGRAEVSLPLPRGPGRPTRWAKPIADARLAVPVALPGWEASARLKGDGLRLELRPPAGAPALKAPRFFPLDALVIEHAAPQRVEGTAFELTRSKENPKAPPRLRGVVVSEAALDGEGRRALLVDAPVQPAAAEGGLAWALLLAFLGGALLNVMPCVFPVLAVKAIGFVEQAGRDPGAARAHGVGYAAGVVVSFWALAGTLLALRAAGSTLGWGFQLHSPAFLAAMTGVLSLLALSLLGVFEIGAGLGRLGGRHGDSAFWSGALAVVVATPCTAPFMGAALGLALTLPAVSAVAIFTALALGMALPTTALSFSPRLLALMPRPGPWLEGFKQAMAFPLLATAAWLGWVFALQTSVDAAARLAYGLLLLGSAAWAYGRWGQSLSPSRARTLGRTAAALLAAAGLGLGAAASGLLKSSGGLDWEPWSVARLEALRAEGKPVFVDFTAAWCLTCQVNERLVLSRADVAKAMSDAGVVPLKADWTSRDAAITQALLSLGRAGVPVYALYPAGSGEPVLLPAVLTPALVKEELAKTAKKL